MLTAFRRLCKQKLTRTLTTFTDLQNLVLAFSRSRFLSKQLSAKRQKDAKLPTPATATTAPAMTSTFATTISTPTPKAANQAGVPVSPAVSQLAAPNGTAVPLMTPTTTTAASVAGAAAAFA